MAYSYHVAKCEACSREYIKKADDHRFCSRACNYRHRLIHKRKPPCRPIQCFKCNKFFTPRNHNNYYCSSDCYENSRPVSTVGQPATCVKCGISFVQKSNNQKFCGKECQASVRKGASYQGLPSSMVGAIGETLICADLMGRGVYVFRSMSPSCPCDLIAMLGEKLYRVEVTMGYWNAKGSYGWAKHDESKYDVLALYFFDGKIAYVPEVFPEIRRLPVSPVVEPGSIPGDD